jgi:hypothetical protein
MVVSRSHCSIGNDNEYDKDVWNFREILNQDGPSLPEYHEKFVIGSFLRWKTGEPTWKPLCQVAKDDLVTACCAPIYALDPNSLDKTGWNKYKNGNHLWEEAVDLEVTQLDEYPSLSDLPDLETCSDHECDMVEDTKRYQPPIGSLQWKISLVRFMDIRNGVMTLLSFRVKPYKAHLEHAIKCIVEYLSEMRHGTVRVRYGKPEYSDLPEAACGNGHSWKKKSASYGNIVTILPTDVPETLDDQVAHASNVDVRL